MSSINIEYHKNGDCGDGDDEDIEKGFVGRIENEEHDEHNEHDEVIDASTIINNNYDEYGRLNRNIFDENGNRLSPRDNTLLNSLYDQDNISENMPILDEENTPKSYCTKCYAFMKSIKAPGLFIEICSSTIVALTFFIVWLYLLSKGYFLISTAVLIGVYVIIMLIGPVFYPIRLLNEIFSCIRSLCRMIVFT